MAEKIWQDRQNAEEYVQRYEQFLERHKNVRCKIKLQKVVNTLDM